MSEIQTETEIEEQEPTGPGARGTRVTLILVLLMTFGILGLFMAFSHLPSAGHNGTTNDLVTPTAVVTQAQGSLNVGRSVNYNGVTLTVTKVVQAASFSDDKKISRPYVVRVYTQTRVSGQKAVGIDFPSVTRLLVPGARGTAPTLVTLTPMTLPNETEAGFFDFSTSSKLDLSTLGFSLGGNTLYFK